jgi:hypothetical protein
MLNILEGMVGMQASLAAAVVAVVQRPPHLLVEMVGMEFFLLVVAVVLEMDLEGMEEAVFLAVTHIQLHLAAYPEEAEVEKVPQVVPPALAHLARSS